MPPAPRTPPRTLFVVHRFESKSLDDSAGVLEVMRPMLASGLLGEHRLLSFGRDAAECRPLVSRRIEAIAAAARHAPVVVYGAGAHTEQFLGELERLNIVALADRDPALHGTTRFGYPVIDLAAIEGTAAHVVVSSRAYEAGILAALRQRLGNHIALHGLYGQSPDAELRAGWEAELLATVSAFRPELLVHTPVHPQENIERHVFEAARARCPGMKIVTLWWDYDEQMERGSYLDYERESLQWADLVIENSNATRLTRMRAGRPPYQHHRHADRVFFHPTVFDPALFYPESDVTPRYDIALFGSSVGRRRDWIDRLTARYGDRFHHLGGVNEPGRLPLPVSDYAAALRRTKICVNTQTYPFRTQCKGKVREALGCGVLLLEEDNPETRLILAPGEGVEYFRGEDELFALIDHYLADDVARRATVARGQEIWRARMNARGWTERVLASLWPAQGAAHVSP